MNQEIPVSNEILRIVARLDHFRGAWRGGFGVPPARLERIREAAAAQSVAASCRMAGMRVSDSEVGSLILDPAAAVRDKHEILGMARALGWAPPSSDPLLSAEWIGRLHALVTGRDEEQPKPTPWRTRVASREVFNADGTALGRVFQTLPPRMLPKKMNELLAWLEFELRAGERHPVPVIGTFVLSFMAASPFERANGRISRLLVVHLLERAGYEHVRYASVDRVIEESRDAYYDAYDAAESRLWAGEANLTPWLDYFLGVLDEQRRRVESAIDLERRALKLSDLQRRIIETVRDHGLVDAALLIEATGANRNTLKDNMRRLVHLGLIDKTGERRGSRYRLAAAAVVTGGPASPPKPTRRAPTIKTPPPAGRRLPGDPIDH